MSRWTLVVWKSFVLSLVMRVLHAGSALTIRDEVADLERQPREAPDGPEQQELTLPTHVPEADVLDHPVGDLRLAIQKGPQHGRARLIQPRGQELPTPASGKRRSHAINQDYASKLHRMTSCRS
jgi:hypothetical protein